jgi:hypothetical protein
VVEPTEVTTTRPPTTSVRPQTVDDPKSTAAVNAAGVVGGVLGGIIALLGVVLLACGGGVMMRKRKGHYPVDQVNGVHIRRNSMISDGSSAFWQDAENCIEMSPRHSNIDIVPLEHYGSMMETNIDVVANHCVIMSDDPYGSTSLKPLVHNGNSPERGPPKKGGGPAPLGSRPMQTASYADTGTVHTGATTMAGYTSSSIEKSSDYDEDEDEGQLVLPDYDASQAYLSLGLTPLSQLSPDAHTSNDFGFFPSMPPPVAPSTTSLFTTSTSASSLAMDNPFSLHSGGGQSNSIIDSSMMPDAYPERRPRKSKYDNQPLSQGFPLKLEPVMEQSPPISNSQFSGKQNGFSSSGESSKGSPSLSIDPPSRFMFPSAVPSQEFSRLSQGRMALRVKRGGASSRENLTAILPKKTSAHGGGYGSLGVSKHTGRNRGMHSPTKSPTKSRRRQARELKPKERLVEDDRHWQRDQRLGRAGREYSRDSPEPPYPRARGMNPHEMTNGHGQSAFREVEVARRPSSRSRKLSSASSGSTSQTEELSTPRHSRHSSLDETPMGHHRPERSESTHLYTTYEHR